MRKIIDEKEKVWYNVIWTRADLCNFTDYPLIISSQN